MLKYYCQLTKRQVGSTNVHVGNISALKINGIKFIKGVQSVCFSLYSDSLQTGRSGDRFPKGEHILSIRPDGACLPHSLLYNGYLISSGGGGEKGPGLPLNPPPPPPTVGSPAGLGGGGKAAGDSLKSTTPLHHRS